MVRLKTCKKCAETKPVSEFYKAQTGKDGLRGDCRSCSREVTRRWKNANREREAEYHRLWKEKNPKTTAYLSQKNNAKIRGIKFLLTFEEWRDWWGDDFDNRGCTTDKLVMARIGDEGPYALGNIKKILHSDNLREGHEFRRKSKDQILLEV